MKWYVYVICFTLIIVAMFSGVELFRTLSARSSVYGSVTSVKVERDALTSYSFDYLVWTNTNNEYLKMFTVDYGGRVQFDGEKNNYEITINGYPCSNSVTYAGMITSAFSMSFYDTYGQVAATTALSICIEFLNDKVRLTMYGSNQGNALSYLNNLIASDGFLIEVLEVKNEQN